MAINIKFDTTGNPEPPSIILATKNGNKLGQLNVNADSIELNDKLKVSEISFTLNKYIDGKLNNLWDKVVDFKLVWCKEWDCWFEIKVELDEATETVKTVFGTQLGQAELSQIMVYNMEVNTEEDIARDDYKITILYDENDHEASLLHRILKDKAPHYSIAYVDPTIARIQRQFSWDGSSICDVLDEIEEEIGCLVVYNSNSIEGGKPNRSISVYDLEQNCNNCGHRGEFTDKCPKCESTNIKYGYGEDTTIFVTADELASEGVQLVTDVNSVKNCFKLEAGDDLMTATIRNCNPNGSDYIWRFSDDIKKDMSVELVEKIESYDAKYKQYYNEYKSNLDTDLLTKYNGLVEKYYDFYNTKSTCLSCGKEGNFYDKCDCGSENLLTGKELQKISNPVVGYSALMNAYYNTIDFALYLESSLMPSIEMSDTTAEKQAKLLTTSSLSPVAVNVKEVGSISETTADSAVLSMAKVIVKSTYKVEILSSSLSAEKKWSGTFKITNYSDDTDKAEVTVNGIVVNNNNEKFIQQKIEKALNKEDTDDYSISGLFEKDYDKFCVELKKYGLNPLKSFYDAAEACISILTEQGAGNQTDKPDLYESLYKPYYQKQEAIASEIKVRENELVIIEGVYDEATDTTTGGLQNIIQNCQSVIQEALNFENHLGTELWKEFCSFRREDKYSNSNYTSDGLNNAELFERALEFIEVAENEIYKASELQHSISTSLNNLLAVDKFKPLIKSFKNGNWIRVRVNDEIYKLRLLEYSINFGSFDSIPVEFSDVTKVKNGITDVKDIIEQASSMASSYDAVTRQAQKGNVAKGTIEQWLDEGLNSANVRIQSNDSEEILITKNGLLARSYDDITGSYSPEQFKLTHNIMAYTTDDWKTVSTALGKHRYKYWDGKNFVDDEDYGLSTKFVQAGYIGSSQFIGGEIVSYNYEPNQKGTYINLVDGDFEFAGGKIVYNVDKSDESKSTLTLKGVTIQWDTLTDKPTIENINGLSGITDDIETIQKGLQATTINGQYVISPHIVGGDLKIVNDDGTTSAEINNSGKLTATGADITGHITATSLTLGSGVTISTTNIDGIDEYAKIGEIEGVPDNVITTDDITISESTTENGITIQEVTVGDKKYTNIISGDFIFTDIGLGTDTTDGSKQYTCISKDGLLTAKNAIIYGTVYATEGKFTGDIVANSLTLGNGVKISTEDIDGIDQYAKIGEIEGVPDNIITADDVEISSTTTSNGITTQTITVGDNTYTSIISGDFVLTNVGLGTNTDDGSETYTCISTDGLLTAKNAIIYGTVYATNGKFNGEIQAVKGSIGGFTIEPIETTEDGSISGGWLYSDDKTLGSDDSIFLSATDMSGKVSNTTLTNWRLAVGEHFGVASDGTSYMSNCEITGGSLRMGTEANGYYTWISKDGVLNAKGVNIDGVITAISGEIGNCTINTDGSIVSANGNFKVDASGNLTATGNGNIGGWQITTNALYKNVSGISSGMCSMQTEMVPSEGLSYTLNSDGNSYTVSGIGDCTDINVVIPNTYNDKPVTTIGNRAFENCTNLITVVIGDSVISIGYRAFYSCTSLTNMVIPDSVTVIGQRAFSDCDGLTNVVIGDNVTEIDNYAFASCANLTSVDIGDRVTTIGYGAFANCTNLMSVVIPDSVTTIDSEAFKDCASLESVYYAGSENDWNEIDIGVSNSYLKDAYRYYNYSCNCISLVKDGNISPPRFFAGSISNIPTSVDDARFLVLEDGSLYADAAHIEGHIEADSGNIGGLTIQTDSISSGTDGLTFLPTGLVLAKQLEISDYFKANTLQIGTISGRYNKGSYLDFEGTDREIETVTVTIASDVTNEGSLHWFTGDIQDAGSVILTVKTSKALTDAKTFEVKAGYGDVVVGYHPNEIFIYETVNITIPAGEQTGTATVVNIKRKDGCSCYFSSNRTTVSPSNYTQYLPTTLNSIKCCGTFSPITANSTYQLGSSDFRWKEIWCQTNLNTTSDRNEKNSIECLSDKYEVFFDKLQPVRYKFNQNESNRYHVGFIAQDVADALNSAEIPTSDFAGYLAYEKEDGSMGYGLRYGEFIALNTCEIQKLKKRVEELERKLEVLENK